uniref:Uncharacterized protein n=1 Tax=Arundo donax TaxID=35708 RepID=A0A0A9QT37_ARUDO
MYSSKGKLPCAHSASRSSSSEYKPTISLIRFARFVLL